VSKWLLSEEFLRKSVDELTRLLALSWIHSFVLVGREVLVPYAHSVLGAVLPSVSSDSTAIREKAIETNSAISLLIENVGDSGTVNVDTILQQISLQLRSEYVNTRLAALRWVSLLHASYPQALEDYLDKMFSILLKMLADTSEVVTLCLEVMAKIATNEEYFLKLMTSLISIFSGDPSLLEKKGSSALRQLSLYIPPQKVRWLHRLPSASL
jgi:vacuole morphology and inheritance protein 14